ncbi:hypothetical protein VNO80_01578 [Phaseolus coccineus]|uniref:Uncharacterized protein n=1 Tax=Phaseolus coccineus TaxID=3886 RepID=A0AAN9RT19_PHACN
MLQIPPILMNSILTHHVVTRESHEDKLPETKISVEGNRPDQEKAGRSAASTDLSVLARHLQSIEREAMC